MTDNTEETHRLPDVFAGSWSKFVEVWCGGHAPGYEPAVAIDALRTVGELWPESVSGIRGLYPACGLIELGKLLSAVRSCDGFDALLPRLKRQDQGAHAELIVAGGLIRSGLKIRLGVPCNNHVLDLAVEDASGPIFVEVTAPHEAESLTAQRELVLDLSLQLSSASDCYSVVVEFRDDPTPELVEAIVTQLPSDESGEWRNVGSARFRRWLSPPDRRELSVEWPGIDCRTERVVIEKSKQLARDVANVLVIDMGSVGGSIAEWVASIGRLFQPTKNRRFGAIVMFQSLFSAHWDRGYRLWWTIENPYATHPIPESIVRALRALDESDVVRNARGRTGLAANR